MSQCIPWLLAYGQRDSLSPFSYSACFNVVLSDDAANRTGCGTEDRLWLHEVGWDRPGPRTEIGLLEKEVNERKMHEKKK